MGSGRSGRLRVHFEEKAEEVGYLPPAKLSVYECTGIDCHNMPGEPIPLIHDSYWSTNSCLSLYFALHFIFIIIFKYGHREGSLLTEKIYKI